MVFLKICNWLIWFKHLSNIYVAHKYGHYFCEVHYIWKWILCCILQTDLHINAHYLIFKEYDILISEIVSPELGIHCVCTFAYVNDTCYWTFLLIYSVVDLICYALFSAASERLCFDFGSFLHLRWISEPSSGVCYKFGPHHGLYSSKSLKFSVLYD